MSTISEKKVLFLFCVSLKFWGLVVIWQQLTDITSVTKDILRNEAELCKMHTGGYVSKLTK